MNTTKKSFLGVLVILALFAITIPQLTRAAEFSPIKTVWSFAGTDTNNPTVATNLASIIDVREFTEIGLQFRFGLTNASTGTITVQWDTSMDGVNFCANPACPGTSGWFAVPLTNGGTFTTWTTNITVGSFGYYRINYMTNVAVQHFTNAQVLAYAKPSKTSLR